MPEARLASYLGQNVQNATDLAVEVSDSAWLWVCLLVSIVHLHAYLKESRNRPKAFIIKSGCDLPIILLARAAGVQAKVEKCQRHEETQVHGCGR